MHFVVTMIILLFFTSRSSKLAGILIESYSAEQHRRAAVGAGGAAWRRRCGSAFVRPSNRVCTFHVGKPEAIVCSQLRQGLPTKSQGQDGETIATSCGHSPSTTCLAGKGLDSYAVLWTEPRLGAADAAAAAPPKSLVAGTSSSARPCQGPFFRRPNFPFADKLIGTHERWWGK